MKRFIAILAVFMLPVVAALGTIEYKLRAIPNEYTAKDEYLKKNSDNIEVLYVGNSHIYFGMDPEFSKYKAYNAAYTSQSADLDWKIVNKYRDAFKALKYIVLPADYISVYQTLDQTAEGWRIKNYNIYYGFTSELKPGSYLEICNGKFQENIHKLNAYYLQHIPLKRTSSASGFGTSYLYPHHEDLIESTAKAIKRHSVKLSSSEAKKSFEQNTQALDNFIRFAEQKHIQLIFVSTPVTEMYFNQSRREQLENSLAVYSDLAKKHPEICHYYNFMQDTRFNTSDFYDGDHLNNLGAKKLTELVDQKIDLLKK